MLFRAVLKGLCKGLLQGSARGTLIFQLGNRKGAGQSVSCDFGGGGETYYRVETSFGGEVGFGWSVPVSSKEMTGREQTGRGGGGNVS